jgi:DNA-binding protein H-NS
MARKAQKVSRKSAVKAAPKKAAPKKAPVRRVAVSSDFRRLISSLEELTAVDLKKVIEHAQAMLEQKTEGDRRSFIAEVTSRAKDMGMSVADLFGKAIPDSLRSKTQGKGKAAVKTWAAAPVKFKSPSGETWAGRGRPPRWLTALEAEGKTRSDFAV